MKSIIFSLLFTLLFAACAMAESYNIYYPSSTSNTVMNEARSIITTFGGTITKNYNGLKAFAATADATTIERIKAYGHGVTVENDNVVTAPSYKAFRA